MDNNEFCLKDLTDMVENDERILQFKFQYKNTLVWPFIRCHIYRIISDKKFNIQESLGTVNRSTPIRTCLHEFIKCIKIGLNIPLRWKTKDILYLCSASANIVSNEGKKFNRIYGGFISEYSEQSGIIEMLGNEKYEKNTRDDIRYIDSINFLIEVLSHLSRSNRKDISLADSVVNYLCNECKLTFSEEEILIIKRNILLHSKRIRYVDKIYSIIFRQIAPKIVFLTLGHYGDKNAYLIKILHSMGIKTAEVQHGLLTMNHEAYAYSDFLCNSPEYAIYSPDFFLVWGKYWLNKISIPGSKISVGNPFFWQQYYSIIESANSQKGSNCKTILWLAFNDNDKNIMFLDKFIDISHNAYNIRVRLHPTLRGLKVAYKKYENNDKIILDELQTVYESFTEADYVILEASTVVYEALAVGKRVYVLDSEESRAFEIVELAPCFRSSNELLALMTQKESNRSDNEDIAKELFGEMWQVKFKQFIEMLEI